MIAKLRFGGFQQHPVDRNKKGSQSLARSCGSDQEDMTILPDKRPSSPLYWSRTRWKFRYETGAKFGIVRESARISIVGFVRFHSPVRCRSAIRGGSRLVIRLQGTEVSLDPIQPRKLC